MQKENTVTENAKEIKDVLPKVGLTPKQLHEQLNEYIIGQDEAKKTLCVGMYNHWKRVLMNKMGQVQEKLILLKLLRKCWVCLAILVTQPDLLVQGM